MVKRKESNHKYLWVILEVAFVIAVIAMQAVGYVYLFGQINFPMLESNSLIQSSFVGGSFGSVATWYSVEWLFSYALRALFMFVGNHIEAVIVLQFVMQMFASFTIYRGIRRIIGRILSCVLYIAQAVVYFILLPDTLISPCWMALLACALVFYLLTLIITGIIIRKANKKNIIEAGDKISEEVAEDKVVEEKVFEEKTVENSITDDKPVIKFLDNPLPGPKKHVSKTLDFDLKDENLADVSMEYDIEVSDDDDFDL